MHRYTLKNNTLEKPPLLCVSVFVLVFIKPAAAVNQSFCVPVNMPKYLRNKIKSWSKQILIHNITICVYISVFRYIEIIHLYNISIFRLFFILDGQHTAQYIGENICFLTYCRHNSGLIPVFLKASKILQ